MSSQTIIVGSQSPIKINAIKDAFRSFTVIGVNCNSSVHEQPVGLEETEKGARHRAKCAFDSFKNMNLYYAIGIENGMVSTENGWVDLAAIVIIDHSGKETTLWSEEIKIPEEAVRSCMNANGREFRNWSPLKDPHFEISGKSRQNILSDALKKWKNKQVWGL